MVEVVLNRLHKRFPNGTNAVCDLSLRVAPGELLVLTGPSGSGKTTTLRLIAGLESVDSGEIFLAGHPVTHHAPHRRQVALSFQSPALFPHLSVRENLVFHQRLRYNLLRRWSRPWPEDLRRNAEEVGALLRLDALLDRRPAELSGGERQRVALGRVLIRRPAVFLLDEPLAQLEGPLRVRIRQAVRDLQRQRQTTTLWVTHDVAEAFAVADRVAVMEGGRLLQVGAPGELQQAPANEVVAELLSVR
jgi:ABC-type sugar transport system ATPase subunit